MVLSRAGNGCVEAVELGAVERVPVVCQFLHLSRAEAEVRAELGLEGKLLVNRCSVGVAGLKNLPLRVVVVVVEPVPRIGIHSVDHRLISDRVIN